MESRQEKISLEGLELRSQGWGWIWFHSRDLERVKDTLPSAGLQGGKSQGSCTVPIPPQFVFSYSFITQNAVLRRHIFPYKASPSPAFASAARKGRTRWHLQNLISPATAPASFKRFPIWQICCETLLIALNLCPGFDSIARCLSHWDLAELCRSLPARAGTGQLRRNFACGMLRGSQLVPEHMFMGVLSKYRLSCTGRSPPGIAPMGCSRVRSSTRHRSLRAPMGRSRTEEQLPASRRYFTLMYRPALSCFDVNVILFSFSVLLLLSGVICQHEVFLISVIKLFY